MKKLVVIAGPTAVGKSDIAVRLAKRVGGEIISADSMQVYRLMDIGTAKLTPVEMQGVPHHLIDILEPTEEFNIVRFQELALSAMEKIYQDGKLPIIAGGTGFYIQSVAYGIEFASHEQIKIASSEGRLVVDDRTDGVDLGKAAAEENGLHNINSSEKMTNSYREYLSELAKREGPHVLHEMLQKIDQKSAEMIHENNIKRVIRALEFYEETGEKLSEHNSEQRQKQSPYDLRYYVLDMPRPLLYERIDRRVDQMLEEGLLDEVRRLLEMGLTERNLSMQGLGYKQLLSCLKGEIPYEEAVRLIKRDTRHFAKRQLTWFKREKDVRWIELEKYDYDPKRVVEYLVEDIGYGK
ncbi:MAG: tRNA (adenosine(37)-N6)-dimethylallyltransferase MiaA [Lachnospiraceae bacterium]|nr:tRNA (adenosine(37)-N6)-dimethylallyltransferase MiaA [Lachnospiraceae bacterium]